MLVLTRKLNQKVRINDDIVIMIVKIIDEFGQVKIGIEAPEDVSIDREEIKKRRPEKRNNYLML